MKMTDSELLMSEGEKVKNQIIDFERHMTHRIFPIAENVKKHFMKRNCDFVYWIDPKTQKKTYKAKDL